MHEGAGTTFGRADYWDAQYREADAKLGFSWYSGWVELEPFWRALVPSTSARVLLPGIGNDAAMVEMYDAGWTSLSAFDLSEEAIARASDLFGPERLLGSAGVGAAGVSLAVADARELPFEASSFDAVLDKGTLDAVYLAGGLDKAARRRSLRRAVDELARVVRPGGVVLSVTAAAEAHLPAAFLEPRAEEEGARWRVLWDGSVFVTEEGDASINVDATMLAWERL